MQLNKHFNGGMQDKYFGKYSHRFKIDVGTWNGKINDEHRKSMML